MAKKNNTKRKIIALVSQLSGHRTYVTRKNTANTPGKLTLRKYDPKLSNMSNTSRIPKNHLAVMKLNRVKAKSSLSRQTSGPLARAVLLYGGINYLG